MDTRSLVSAVRDGAADLLKQLDEIDGLRRIVAANPTTFGGSIVDALQRAIAVGEAPPLPCEYREATGQSLLGRRLYHCRWTDESVTSQPLTLPGQPGDVMNFEPKSCARCQGQADATGVFTQGCQPSGEVLADDLRRRWASEPESLRDIPDVTLACIDCVNPQLAAMALDVSSRGLQFARVVLFSNEPVDVLPPDIEWFPTRRLDKDGYNRFCLSELYRHIHTSHVLTIQADGFVLRPERWDDSWLACDYCGPVWPWHKRHAVLSRVGNSGICLRSKRLLQETAKAMQASGPDDYKWDGAILDDVVTCYYLYQRLIDAGLVFAPVQDAIRFAVEERTEFVEGLQWCFGFHNQHHAPARQLVAELPAWMERTRCRI